jgi:hypothetical protein
MAQHEIITLLSLVTDLLPAALSGWLFLENQKLKRLDTEKQLQIKELEYNLELRSVDINYGCGSPISPALPEDDIIRRRKLETLHIEMNHLKKILGK